MARTAAHKDPILQRLRQTGQQLDLLWISGRHAAQTRCLMAVRTTAIQVVMGVSKPLLQRDLVRAAKTIVLRTVSAVVRA